MDTKTTKEKVTDPPVIKATDRPVRKLKATDRKVERLAPDWLTDELGAKPGPEINSDLVAPKRDEG